MPIKTNQSMNDGKFINNYRDQRVVKGNIPQSEGFHFDGFESSDAQFSQSPGGPFTVTTSAWTNLGSQNGKSFTNESPGRYFEISARGNAGSPHPAGPSGGPGSGGFGGGTIYLEKGQTVYTLNAAGGSPNGGPGIVLSTANQLNASPQRDDETIVVGGGGGGAVGRCNWGSGSPGGGQQGGGNGGTQTAGGSGFGNPPPGNYGGDGQEWIGGNSNQGGTCQSGAGGGGWYGGGGGGVDTGGGWGGGGGGSGYFVAPTPRTNPVSRYVVLYPGQDTTDQNVINHGTIYANSGTYSPPAQTEVPQTTGGVYIKVATRPE